MKIKRASLEKGFFFVAENVRSRYSLSIFVLVPNITIF